MSDIQIAQANEATEMKPITQLPNKSGYRSPILNNMALTKQNLTFKPSIG